MKFTPFLRFPELPAFAFDLPLFHATRGLAIPPDIFECLGDTFLGLGNTFRQPLIHTVTQ